MLSFFDSAVQEAQLLHSREEGCSQRSGDALFFSIFRKTGGRPVQRSYRMPQLESVVAATTGQQDVYLSQSSFWSFSRKIVNFKQTRAAWVDLDLYNQGLSVDSATVRQILALGETLGIPTPTSIISSGRGCYLKWVFETPVMQSHLPTWNLLQSTLTAAYSSLAADFSARDAARVFRLIDTLNSKSGGKVERVDGCGKLYDFAGMCRAVEGLRTEVLVESTKARVSSLTRKAQALTGALKEGAERGDVAALSLYSEIRQPILMESLSARSLNWARFCDLRDLYIRRGGIPEGQRDTALFWMLNFLGQAGVVGTHNWDAEVSELLRAFPNHATFKPLQDGSMGTLFERLKAKEAGQKFEWRGRQISPMYHPGNQHLIEAFGIKPEEMAHLATVISPEEKQIRVDQQNPGRHERREERNRWREEVREAFKSAKEHAPKDAGSQVQKMNLTALARYVGVERTRVSRFWAELVKTDGAAVKVATKPRKSPVQSVAPLKEAPAAELPSATPEDALTRLRAALGLSKVAHEKAHEAERSVRALAIQTKLQKARDAWAMQKLRQVCTPEESNLTGESDMATSKLAKSKALLAAAKMNASETPPSDGVQSSALPATVAPAVAAEPVASAPSLIAPAQAVGPSADQGWIAASVPPEFSGVFNDSPAQDDGMPEFAPVDGALPVEGGASQGDLAPAPAVQRPKQVSLRERLAAKSTQLQESVASGRAQYHQPAAAPAPRQAAAQPAAAPMRPLVDGGPAAPAGYPSPAEWPSNDIPPGSAYSAEEWAMHRKSEGGVPYSVIEIHTRQSSWLAQVPTAYIRRSTQAVDGKLVATESRVMPEGLENPGMCDALSQVFSDCIFIADQAPARFPGALEASVQFGGVNYRVVRPRRDYLEPGRAFRCGSTFHQPFDMKALVASMPERGEAAEPAPSDAPTA